MNEKKRAKLMKFFRALALVLAVIMIVGIVLQSLF